jgi:hypothetical protein
MTYSDCWIDTVDDDEFRAYKAQQMAADGETGRFGRLYVLPRPLGVSHYWLPIVKDWATERGLEIEWVDSAWIKVAVSRAQLQQFLEEVFGTGMKLDRVHVERGEQAAHVVDPDAHRCPSIVGSS